MLFYSQHAWLITHRNKIINASKPPDLKHMTTPLLSTLDYVVGYYSSTTHITVSFSQPTSTDIFEPIFSKLYHILLIYKEQKWCYPTS